jgi:hypothetical protein
MGIGVVLIIWAVVGFALASLGSVVMMAAAKFLTRRAAFHRHAFVLAVGIFPFVGLGWAGVVFVFQAVVNEGFLHRDAGAGDSWTCPLPNGYTLSFIDTMDQGWIYDPKTQMHDDAIDSQQDAISGVRLLQVSGQYILGGATSEEIPSEHAAIDHYFLIDGRIRTRRDFGSLESLKSDAVQKGLKLDLQPVDEVYRRYRFTWFDAFAAFLFCAPLAVYAGLLLWWLIRLRRNKTLALTTA